MDSTDICEICCQPFDSSPHSCLRSHIRTEAELRAYQPTQAELIERMATHWHNGPHRQESLIKATCDRIAAVLAHAGLQLKQR